MALNVISKQLFVCPNLLCKKTVDTPKGCYDINCRAVKAFVAIGKGHRASESFDFEHDAYKF